MHSTQNTVTAVAGHPQIGMFRVLLGHVRELPRQRHDLEQAQNPEQQYEEDSEKGYCSMLFNHASTIAYIVSNVNRYLSSERLDDQAGPGASRRPRLHGALRGWVVQLRPRRSTSVKDSEGMPVFRRAQRRGQATDGTPPVSGLRARARQCRCPDH